ncbi:unnamed protein product [Moneuplotes crassus]|uniref:Uncharacterized protein n=1 Tax=Euplotes crassus TaxID=5936 RepID=A0AAD1U7F5_EUPCR|nr:unnamed protein product [Moneuplotes crassus]
MHLIFNPFRYNKATEEIKLTQGRAYWTRRNFSFIFNKQGSYRPEICSKFLLKFCSMTFETWKMESWRMPGLSC